MPRLPGNCTRHEETPVEGKVVVATLALIAVTWLLYKLAEWLEPRK